MTEKYAFWMKYRIPQKDDRYVVVIAETLEEVFKMVINQYKVANENIFYLNRELTVLLPF